MTPEELRFEGHPVMHVCAYERHNRRRRTQEQMQRTTRERRR